MSKPTSVSMAGFTWETGKEVVDAEVTLGSADKSSTLKVTLSDPEHKIAAALVNHSIANKGIQALPDAEKPSLNKSVGISKPSGITGTPTVGSMAASGEQFTPKVKAFLDAVVMRETATAKTDIAKSYTALNGGGYLTNAQIAAAGFPPSSLTPGGRNIGRYQVNPGDWGEAVKAGFAKNDFSPTSQDGVALFKLFKRNRGGAELQAGDIKGAFRKAANEWVSIPGGAQYQPQAGTGTPEEILAQYYAYYQERLAFYEGKGNAPKPSTSAVATKAPNKVLPPSPAESSTGKPVIKGSTISINIDGFLFDFIHQGTDTSDDGTTVLTGQGVRWLMSRTKRNRTLKDLSLKDLAAKIAKDHKVKLDYKSSYNPTYSHIDQSGISDYKLLLREAQESGLLVSEAKGVLVIADRQGIADSKFLLKRGINLISYQISDKAVGSNAEDISAKLPQEAKGAIDPVTGKVKVVAKDTDRSQSGAVTGVAKGKTKGTLKTGAAQQLASKAKTKRIFALPSTFVIPLSQESLKLVPLSACTTEGFPDPLDRTWYIQLVTHSLGANTTTLQVSSPMEVLDNGASAPAAGNAKALSKATGDLGKGFIYPVSGTVSDTQITPKRHHGGVDIAAPAGTPIYAAESGVVASNKFQAGGGGWMLCLKHEDGLYTNYFHQLVQSSLREGTKVSKGDQIGVVGSTGGSTGNHLHFELCKGLYSGRLLVERWFPDMSKKGNTITALKPVGRT